MPGTADSFDFLIWSTLNGLRAPGINGCNLEAIDKTALEHRAVKCKTTGLPGKTVGGETDIFGTKKRNGNRNSYSSAF